TRLSSWFLSLPLPSRSSRRRFGLKSRASEVAKQSAKQSTSVRLAVPSSGKRRRRPCVTQRLRSGIKEIYGSTGEGNGGPVGNGYGGGDSPGRYVDRRFFYGASWSTARLGRPRPEPDGAAGLPSLPAQDPRRSRPPRFSAENPQSVRKVVAYGLVGPAHWIASQVNGTPSSQRRS